MWPVGPTGDSFTFHGLEHAKMLCQLGLELLQLGLEAKERDRDGGIFSLLFFWQSILSSEFLA
jgi:hypothetical protein